MKKIRIDCRASGVWWTALQILAFAFGTVVTESAARAQVIGPQYDMPIGSAARPYLLLQIAGNGPATFADLAEKVLPAVVGVTTKVPIPRHGGPGQRSFDFGGPNEDGLPMPGGQNRGKAQITAVGSGFFISPDGYAVTNSHVLQNSDTAEILTQDERTYTAKVVGKDPISDLALIKVDGRNDFSYVTIADELPRVGDWVLAVGNPFGLGGTVTAGIVSARHRNIDPDSSEDLIQIDAPINRGDSGGPSFDSNGNVIGVNTMIASPSGGSVGVAFAVPADTIKTVIPQLKAKGSVTRGWIGVQIQSITPDLANGLGLNSPRGAIITSVQRNSPSAKAGLARGDVITSIDGEPIKDAHELTKRIQNIAPGTSAQIGLLRNGNERPVTVTPGQLSDHATNQ
ncbi:MAG: trypsin-like peptidase domain-containing protein [Xanthobacteraceae bacterium]